MAPTVVTSWFFSGMFMIKAMTGTVTAQKEIQHPAAFITSVNVVTNPPVKKNYDENAKSWYAVYKTGNIIHVYLAVTDPAQQRKIVMNGVELWIDTKGKKNKKTGIIFPFVTHNDNEKPALVHPPALNEPGLPYSSHTGPDTNNIKYLTAAIALQREMKLTGFKEDLNGIQNIHHPSGIAVSVYFIKDTLVYDVQLPVNTLSEPVLLHSHLAVCLIEKGMKGMTMAGFGGNDMLPGENGDGMVPPPGKEDGMHLFEDDEIWYKLSLKDAGTW